MKNTETRARRRFRQKTSRNHPAAESLVAGGLTKWNLMHSIREKTHPASASLEYTGGGCRYFFAQTQLKKRQRYTAYHRFRQKTSRNHPPLCRTSRCGKPPEWNLMHFIRETMHPASVFSLNHWKRASLFSWFSDFYRQSGTIYFANHFHLQHFIQRL